MFLIQLASADDKPLKEMHLSPGLGMVLRGENIHMDGNLHQRFEKMEQIDAKYKN
jgi:hypothetical protein